MAVDQIEPNITLFSQALPIPTITTEGPEKVDTHTGCRVTTQKGHQPPLLAHKRSRLHHIARKQRDKRGALGHAASRA
jgi:hypothetical protein